MTDPQPNASDIANADKAAKALNILRADECAIHAAMYARLEAEKRVAELEALLTASKTLFNQIALQRAKLGPLATQAQTMAHKIATLRSEQPK